MRNPSVRGAFGPCAQSPTLSQCRTRGRAMTCPWSGRAIAGTRDVRRSPRCCSEISCASFRDGKIMRRSLVFAIYIGGSIAIAAGPIAAADGQVPGSRSTADSIWSMAPAAQALAPGMVSRDAASTMFDNVFDCEGTILHQSYKGELASPLVFWFGIREDQSVSGVVTRVGAPLGLPGEALSGRMRARHDSRGKFTGGILTLDWPYASTARPLELGLMRETFIRVGPRYNGVGRVIRRTSNHTYAAGSLKFDPASHPALKSFHRVSFVSATCFPENGLPTGSRER